MSCPLSVSRPGPPGLVAQEHTHEPVHARMRSFYVPLDTRRVRGSQFPASDRRVSQSTSGGRAAIFIHVKAQVRRMAAIVSTSRRDFLRLIGAGAVAASLPIVLSGCDTAPGGSTSPGSPRQGGR